MADYSVECDATSADFLQDLTRRGCPDQLQAEPFVLGKPLRDAGVLVDDVVVQDEMAALAMSLTPLGRLILRWT